MNLIDKIVRAREKSNSFLSYYERVTDHVAAIAAAVAEEEATAALIEAKRNLFDIHSDLIRIFSPTG